MQKPQTLLEGCLPRFPVCILVHVYLSLEYINSQFSIYQLGVNSSQARRKREGPGGGGFSRPNDLLEFGYFVSEKAVEAKLMEMKIQIHVYSRKLPES